MIWNRRIDVILQKIGPYVNLILDFELQIIVKSVELVQILTSYFIFYFELQW
jgi:hypothetical protein